MSSISQTKVPLVNIFFGNMIRLNKFPSWLSQNWIFFESPNDRTTCPVIHGFARTMLDSDRTLSNDRPLFQALYWLWRFLSGLWIVISLCSWQRRWSFPSTVTFSQPVIKKGERHSGQSSHRTQGASWRDLKNWKSYRQSKYLVMSVTCNNNHCAGTI